MIESLTYVILLVKDYDEALDFYTKKLGFVKATDVSPTPGMRFLTVAPKGHGTVIMLHKPDLAIHGESEATRMTEQIGKNPGLLFKVDDCKKTCEELKKNGVKILKGPFRANFGFQAVIADLYDNPLVLIEYPK